MSNSSDVMVLFRARWNETNNEESSGFRLYYRRGKVRMRVECSSLGNKISMFGIASVKCLVAQQMVMNLWLFFFAVLAEICEDIDCGLNGACDPLTGACVCSPGFTGDNCDTSKNFSFYC